MFTTTPRISLLLALAALTPSILAQQTTADPGQILPEQSSALSSALEAFVSTFTQDPAWTTIASEIATATAGPEDLLNLAVDGLIVGQNGGASFSAEVASVLAEYPPDVSSWWVSITQVENQIITSVLGTTALPTGIADSLTGTDTGTDTGSATGSGSATQTGSGSVTVSTGSTTAGTGKSTSATGSVTGKSTGSSTGTGTSTSSSKNAGPTLGVMNGVGCGVVAFGAAAACAIGMM